MLREVSKQYEKNKTNRQTDRKHGNKYKQIGKTMSYTRTRHRWVKELMGRQRSDENRWKRKRDTNMETRKQDKTWKKMKYKWQKHRSSPFESRTYVRTLYFTIIAISISHVTVLLKMYLFFFLLIISTDWCMTNCHLCPNVCAEPVLQYWQVKQD